MAPAFAQEYCSVAGRYMRSEGQVSPRVRSTNLRQSMKPIPCLKCARGRSMLTQASHRWGTLREGEATTINCSNAEGTTAT